MSDWNTLFLFDANKFYNKIVVKLKKDKEYLKDFIASKPYNIWYSKNITEQELDEIIKYFKILTDDFKSNSELLKILNLGKDINQHYSDFNSNKNAKIDDFYVKNEDVIEMVNQLLPYLIFSECVCTELNISIGRKIFTSNIQTVEKSFAEELVTNIYQEEGGNTHCAYGSGIINWLSAEEAEILYLDIKNIKAKNNESEGYKNDFVKLIELAQKYNFGLITFSNLQDELLNQLIETQHTTRPKT